MPDQFEVNVQIERVDKLSLLARNLSKDEYCRNTSHLDAQNLIQESFSDNQQIIEAFKNLLDNKSQSIGKNQLKVRSRPFYFHDRDVNGFSILLRVLGTEAANEIAASYIACERSTQGELCTAMLMWTGINEAINIVTIDKIVLDANIAQGLVDRALSRLTRPIYISNKGYERRKALDPEMLANIDVPVTLQLFLAQDINGQLGHLSREQLLEELTLIQRKLSQGLNVSAKLDSLIEAIASTP